MKFSVSNFSFLLTLLFTSSLSAQIYMEKKNGTYKEKYANGITKTSGEIKDHYKTGEWKSYSFDGTPTSVYTYKAGKLDGPYKTYFTNGKLEKEGNYTNQKITGEEKIYFQSGKLKSVKHFDSEGKREGVQMYYFMSGGLNEYTVYGADGSERIFTYFTNGQLSMRRYYINKKREGAQYYYQQTKSTDPLDTFPERVETFHNGDKEGAFLRYGKKHLLLVEAYYKSNSLDSVAREWNYDGSLRYEFHYKAGELHGHCINYENGKKMVEGDYRMGLLEGLHTQYQPELCYTWYKNDDMDSCRCFYADNKLRLYYKMLDPVSYTQMGIEYDSLGRKTKDWKFKNNRLDGPQHFYHPNGKIKSTCEFRKDLPTGTLKAWNAKGMLILTASLDTFGNSTSIAVFSETGEKLKSGTSAFNLQVKNYLPDNLYFDESEGKIYGEWEEEPPIAVEDVEAPYAVEEAVRPDEIFSFAEEMPSFPDFQKYLVENLKYPEDEKSKGKEGTVYVNFTVERDGAITNVKVVKGVPGAPGFDKEAIRVISAMPDWTPGKMNGRPVRVQMTQPVRFKL